MIEGWDRALEGSGEPELPALRLALRESLATMGSEVRLTGWERLKTSVHRVRLEAGAGPTSVVVKLLGRTEALRTRLAPGAWLPAAGLEGVGPALLGTTSESARWVWQVHEDLGDRTLEVEEPDPAAVIAVVTLLAEIHARFGDPPRLAECRRHGRDLGPAFFETSVRDALGALESRGGPRTPALARFEAVRERLTSRLGRLWGERHQRARTLAEIGGADTLLHGDPWHTNIFVQVTPDGLRARLIDWDRCGVGPASYDLSTFLLRFPKRHRGWILDGYRQAAADRSWRMPAAPDLEALFETAEFARYASCVVAPALALREEGAVWGGEALEEIERWFEAFEPVLTEEHGARAWPRSA